MKTKTKELGVMNARKAAEAAELADISEMSEDRCPGCRRQRKYCICDGTGREPGDK